MSKDSKTLRYELTIERDESIDDGKVARALSKFVQRISHGQGILSAKLEITEGSSSALSKDERERLLEAIERVSDDNKKHAMKIARELKRDSDD